MKIQSKNFPDHYFGSDNNFDFKIHTGGSKLNIVSPGLTGEAGTVSLQSAAEPNKYLRNDGFILLLEDAVNVKDNDIFNLDSTWRIREDQFFPGFIRFESVNYPGRFIRHQGYTLKVHPDDGSGLWLNDASFQILPTGENAPAAPRKSLVSLQCGTLMLISRPADIVYVICYLYLLFHVKLWLLCGLYKPKSK